jgi:hypothetical protein
MVEQLQEKEGGSLQLKWKWQEENDPREGTERERERSRERIFLGNGDPSEARRGRILAIKEGRVKVEEEEGIQTAEPRIQLSGTAQDAPHALASSPSQSHDVDIPTHSNYSTACIRCGRGCTSPINENCRRLGGTRRGATKVSGTRGRTQSICGNRGQEGCGIGDK